METSGLVTLIEDRGPAERFYLRSPFRHQPFLIVTFMFVLDLLACAFLLAWRWQQLSLPPISFIAFVAVYLIAAWRLGLRTHEEIHLILAGGTATPEGATLIDKLLRATTNALIGGLIATFMLAGFCLAALGEVLASR